MTGNEKEMKEIQGRHAKDNEASDGRERKGTEEMGKIDGR